MKPVCLPGDPVFVVGTGRCGSSFVHEILCLHEQVGFISNLDDRFASLNFCGRWNNRILRALNGRLTQKGALVRFAPSEAYGLISRRVSHIYRNSFRDLERSDVTPWLRGRMERMFRERMEVQRRPVFIHKYTGWGRIAFFDEIFPDAKFIHVVRDGRAVVNSWLQMDWWDGYRGPRNWNWGQLTETEACVWQNDRCSFASLAALGWCKLVESLDSGRDMVPSDRFLEISYERFVESPRLVLKEIFQFIGLEWSEDFERCFEKQRFLTGRKRGFVEDLGVDEVGRIERIMRSKLLERGYVLGDEKADFG